MSIDIKFLRSFAIIRRPGILIDSGDRYYQSRAVQLATYKSQEISDNFYRILPTLCIGLVWTQTVFFMLQQKVVTTNIYISTTGTKIAIFSEGGRVSELGPITGGINAFMKM